MPCNMRRQEPPYSTVILPHRLSTNTKHGMAHMAQTQYDTTQIYGLFLLCFGASMDPQPSVDFVRGNLENVLQKERVHPRQLVDEGHNGVHPNEAPPRSVGHTHPQARHQRHDIPMVSSDSSNICFPRAKPQRIT